MTRNIVLFVLVGLTGRPLRRPGLADVGRHGRTQHDLGRPRPPGVLGCEDRDEHQVEGADRLDLERKPRRGRRQDLPRHEQRQPQEPRAQGRQGRPHVLPRVRRPVPVAGRDRQAGSRCGERLARSGRQLVAGGRREAGVLRQQPRGARLPGHGGFRGRHERRPVPGRSPPGADRRRRRLEARHEEGAGCLPALHGELVAAGLRGSRLRPDLQRTRQQWRERPCAERTELRRGEQGHRQSRLAGRLSGPGHPARPVGLAGARPRRLESRK